jgi:hypothetical protein
MTSPAEQPPEQAPVSTTSLPADARPVAAKRVLAKPPVLASDILREEVAPIAPAQRLVRIWLGLFALAFVAAAIASVEGFGPASPGVLAGSIATAIVATIGAFLPAPYAARASLAAIAGLVPLALGARGEGPLAACGFDGTLHAATGLVLVTALPGALLFRARYRAFRAARVILAVVLVFCIPAFAFLAMGAIDASATLLARASDGVVAVAVLTALFGFMGEETTGGCGGWATTLVLVHAGRVVLRTLALDTTYGHWGFVFAGIGEFVASTLVSFAIFQLLAALFAREARKVDVHRIVGPSADGERVHSMTSE